MNKNKVIEHKEQFYEFFLKSCSDDSIPTIGTEFEYLGCDQDANAIAYSHHNHSVEFILSQLIDRYQWIGKFQNEHLIELVRDNQRITLEPGAQIEFVGAPHDQLEKNFKEIVSFQEELQSISNPNEIFWITLGTHPKTDPQSISCIPKPRYTVMENYLPKKGSMAHVMMKATASQQASFDFFNLEMAIEMLKISQMMAPFIIAISANSPFLNGKKTSWMSTRAMAWLNTDPDRCIFCPNIFSPNYEINDYIDYILETPLMFIQRKDQILLTPNLNLNEFINNGWTGLKATWEDWELALTTVFPEARLKNFIEVRSMDRNPLCYSMGLIALYKGILYNTKIRKKLIELLSDWNETDFKNAYLESAQKGLQARTDKGNLIEYCGQIYQLALEGLENDLDKSYLTELHPVIFEIKKSPAEILIDRWENEWNRDYYKLLQNYSIQNDILPCPNLRDQSYD